jgi:hypothetical protein
MNVGHRHSGIRSRLGNQLIERVQTGADSLDLGSVAALRKSEIAAQPAFKIGRAEQKTDLGYIRDCAEYNVGVPPAFRVNGLGSARLSA